MTGWWFQPLWKIWVRQLGLLFPTEWKNHPNVPNHQPASYGWFTLNRFMPAVNQSLPFLPIGSTWCFLYQPRLHHLTAKSQIYGHEKRDEFLMLGG
jgi:hypothetical protein